MAKDRLLFLLSFAILGVVAAVLFRQGGTPDVPEPVAIQEQVVEEVAKVEDPPEEVIPLMPGNMAVPYQLDTRPAIVQFFTPGQYIDIIFTSKSDMGFGSVTLTLLRNVRILDIGKDSEGKRAKVADFNKSSAPLEILLEMSPREAEVFSYANLSGNISFAISEAPAAKPAAQKPMEDGELSLDGWGDDDETQGDYGKLANDLLKSSSDENFNSILVTHMVHSLFPKAKNLKVTVTPRGYILEGRSPNQDTTDKIIQILGTLSAEVSRTVINLMKEDTKWTEVLVAKENIQPNDALNSRNYSWAKQKADKVPPSAIMRDAQSDKWLSEVAATKPIPKGELIALNDVRWPREEAQAPVVVEEPQELPTIAPLHGRRIVPFPIPPDTTLAAELFPGAAVDVKFTARVDGGIDVGNLTLFSHVLVLSLRDPNGRNLREVPPGMVPPPPAMVFLELTPHESEVLSYAQRAGSVYLEMAGEQCVPPTCLTSQLLASKSAASFRSIIITHMIRSFFPGIDVRVTAGTRGYAIEGTVPDPQIAAKITEIFAKFVPGGERELVNLLNVRPQQVRICVKVFEVQRSILERLGLNWEALVTSGGGTGAFGAYYPRPPPSEANFFIDLQNIRLGSLHLSALVDMLERDGYGKILAEPNLTTISGETAHFFSGGEFPILVPQGGTLLGTVTIEFKKFGVMLDFTPFVDLNGLITMRVVPEVSNLDKENSVVLDGFVIPSILTRRVDTIVKLWPGQSYLLAGMFLDECVTKDDNLYGLNRIPVLGRLFESYRSEGREQELIIVVTPYLTSEDDCEDTCDGAFSYPAPEFDTRCCDE
ncbi:MAG: RcpC/CpaB family pilus assembly protein [Chlamydiales bacterium]|nr:RcpC/CpaB family pilus assembly protein [Chlamydiales bacterium]